MTNQRSIRNSSNKPVVLVELIAALIAAGCGTAKGSTQAQKLSEYQGKPPVNLHIDPRVYWGLQPGQFQIIQNPDGTYSIRNPYQTEPKPDKK